MTGNPALRGLGIKWREVPAGGSSLPEPPVRGSEKLCICYAGVIRGNATFHLCCHRTDWRSGGTAANITFLSGHLVAVRLQPEPY